MRLDDWNVSNFHEAIEYLQGKDVRPFGGRYSTVERRELEDGTNVVALHYVQTDIVTYHPDYLVIDCNGWRTRTTKDRLNIVLDNLPGHNRIYQEKGVWYFNSGGWNNPNMKEFPYYDGIKVDYDGNLVDFDESSAMVEARRVEKLTRKINRYVRHVKKTIMDGKLEPPSGGDCWICILERQTGDPQSDTHLEVHLDEAYVHATLLMNANDANGYGSSMWNTVLYEYTQTGKAVFGKKSLADHYGRMVRSFFKTRLGIAR